MKIQLTNLRQADRHINALAKIADCDFYTAEQIYLKLRRLETRQNNWNTQDCNGYPELTEEEQEKRDQQTVKAVKKLLPELKTFFINGDPRGYALKIQKEEAEKYELHQDFGAYGILAPEF